MKHVLRTSLSTGLVVLTVAAGARSASAQGWCTPPGPQVVSYLDCALRLEGDQLVRGSHETVAIADRFSGFALRRFVSGDSAERHADLYERGAARAGAVRFVGGALLLAGSIITLTHPSPEPRGGVRPLGAGPRMMFAGVSIHLLSYPLKWQADREAERAVWWNNAGLRREP